MDRQDLSSDLDIPDWVPPIIHPWTREKYQLAIKTRQDLNAAMIKRLACDNRMKKVWVKLPETVRLEFFRTAVMLLEHPILMQPRPSYTEVAARLREDARVLGTRRPGKTFARLAMPIRKAAMAYETLAKTEPPRDEVKRAVRDLSCYFTERLGRAHYQTTATVASVALNRAISPDDVRNWLRTEAVNLGKTG
jgi:hypothetical protein